ncbi:hypothetical protein IJJ97_06855 [bacterium]|nr:hypothetical protein [bacterium]
MLLLFVCTFISSYYYSTQLEDKLLQANKILLEKQQELDQQEQILKDIKPLRNKVSETKRAINFYKGEGCLFFGDLSSFLPNNMKVNDISVDSKTPHLIIFILSGDVTEKEGITPKESISNFVKKIKKSEYLKNAKITNLSQDKITEGKNNKVSSWNIKIEYPSEF